MAIPSLRFIYFLFFSHSFTENTVDFSGIRTRTVRIEGELAHHLTTTTALKGHSLNDEKQEVKNTLGNVGTDSQKIVRV